VEELMKNVPAKVFDLDGSKYLLILLEEKKSGIPVFDKVENG
jgi:hypothetical protein